jgi:hypothetical protein
MRSIYGGYTCRNICCLLPHALTAANAWTPPEYLTLKVDLLPVAKVTPFLHCFVHDANILDPSIVSISISAVLPNPNVVDGN